jgi:hypothetical protein
MTEKYFNFIFSISLIFVSYRVILASVKKPPKGFLFLLFFLFLCEWSYRVICVSGHTGLFVCVVVWDLPVWWWCVTYLFGGGV